jgi:ADP-ribose pyrophosphatase
MTKFEEKTVATAPIFKGRIIEVQVDTVTLPNGEQSKREIVKHPGAVGIIPITHDGKLIVVEQYRKALERTIVEIPAGKLEPGEAPNVCALRELEEETGYGTQQLTYLQEVVTSPGFCDEVVHIFVAHDIFKIDNPASLDDDEFVEVKAVTLDEAQQLMAEGAICDAKTIIAVMWLHNHLRK